MRARLAVALVVLASTPALAQTELGFRTPIPVSPAQPNSFVLLKPGGAQNLQFCATKRLLDQLLVPPGQRITVEYQWKLVDAPRSLAQAGTKTALPVKDELSVWADNETQLCSAGVVARYEAFPQPGTWEVSASVRAAAKQLGGKTVQFSGGLARIRVEPPAQAPAAATEPKPGPPPAVVPPPGGAPAPRATGSQQPKRKGD